jgi:hypothetical protein
MDPARGGGAPWTQAVVATPFPLSPPSSPAAREAWREGRVRGLAAGATSPSDRKGGVERQGSPLSGQRREETQRDSLSLTHKVHKKIGVWVDFPLELRVNFIPLFFTIRLVNGSCGFNLQTQLELL